MVSAACRALCYTRVLLQLWVRGRTRRWLPTVWQWQLLQSSERPLHAAALAPGAELLASIRCRNRFGVTQQQKLQKFAEVQHPKSRGTLCPASCPGGCLRPTAREVLCSLLSRQKGPCGDSSSAAFWNPPVLCAGSQERSRLQSVQQSHLFHFPAPTDLQIETHMSLSPGPRGNSVHVTPGTGIPKGARPHCCQQSRAHLPTVAKALYQQPYSSAVPTAKHSCVRVNVGHLKVSFVP